MYELFITGVMYISFYGLLIWGFLLFAICAYYFLKIAYSLLKMAFVCLKVAAQRVKRSDGNG